jgi:hypothetical protein
MFNNVLGSIGWTFLILRARSLSAYIVIILQQCTSAINERQGQEGLGVEGVAALHFRAAHY